MNRRRIKYECNPEILHDGTAQKLGRIDASGFHALEDAVLHVRLDAIVLGGRRDSLESGLQGKTDHDAVRKMRANSSGGGGKGLRRESAILAGLRWSSTFECETKFGRKRDSCELPFVRAAEQASISDTRQGRAVRELQDPPPLP